MRSLAPLFATCLLGVVALADVAHAGPPQPTSAAGTPLLLFHPAQPTVPLPRRLATPPVAKRGRGAAKSPWDGTYMSEQELDWRDCSGFPVFNPKGPDDQAMWATTSQTKDAGVVCPESCQLRTRPRVINNKLVFDLVWRDGWPARDKERGALWSFHRTQIELPLTLRGDLLDRNDDPREKYLGGHVDLIVRPGLRYKGQNGLPAVTQTLRIRARVAVNTNPQAGKGVFLRLLIGVPAGTSYDDPNSASCSRNYPRTDFRFNQGGDDDGGADTNSCRRECARERRQCLHNCGKDSKCTFGCMDRASDCSNGC